MQILKEEKCLAAEMGGSEGQGKAGPATAESHAARKRLQQKKNPPRRSPFASKYISEALF
jgi:hypothetical protein